MSTEIRNRSATETRHEVARPLRRGLILALDPYDSEGSPKVQYRRLRFTDEPGGVEAVEAAPARVGIGQLLRQRAQIAVGG